MSNFEQKTNLTFKKSGQFIFVYTILKQPCKAAIYITSKYTRKESTLVSIYVLYTTVYKQEVFLCNLFVGVISYIWYATVATTCSKA